MSTEVMIDRLTEIFRDIFEDDTLTINPQMTAADIDEWDSLSHIRLIVATEREFEVRFSQTEVEKLENVGDFMTLIEEKSRA